MIIKPGQIFMLLMRIFTKDGTMLIGTKLDKQILNTDSIDSTLVRLKVLG